MAVISSSVQPQHDWDPTPHEIVEGVEVQDIRLGDVIIGGAFQVEGIGKAEHRGKPAIRLDLDYLVGPAEVSSARLIIPVGLELYDVKRYLSPLSQQGEFVPGSSPEDNNDD